MNRESRAEALFQDISLPVGTGFAHPSMPGLAADPGLRIETLRRHADTDGDGQVIRAISARLHVGTHVDAPEHYVPAGAQVMDIPLGTYVGPAVVVSLGGLEPGQPIDVGLLRRAIGERAAPGSRLLLKSGWNARFGQPGWREGSPYLTVEAVDHLCRLAPALIGVDFSHAKDAPEGPRRYYLSHALCTAGIVVLAGLRLDQVSADGGLLIAAPIAIHGVEAAPVRALFRPDTPPGSDRSAIR
ncbi:cyclase family protein [Actinomadura graeca]|uniref:Cyclase family protein n=1 Tax=Actinomadura graeca TaxID=2750812 RepID=A0ABX8QQL8_9ACTN|nr:cyclase family protein [Actinomadura graeca]QXJ21085.1 cyclase family protein [Actinomadura graeca]